MLLKHLPQRIKTELVEAGLAGTIGAAAKVRQQHAAKQWAFKYWPERTNDSAEHLPEHEDWRRAKRDQVDLMTFRYGIPRKREMITEEDVAGRMGVPFFLVRRLGGAAEMGKYLPPEQWRKYVNTTEQFLPINANGYELQTNLRAALAWATQPIRPFHGTSRKLQYNNMLYVFMGNGAGKSHMHRINRRAQDLDSVWMDTHGSIRQRADAAWEKSCFEDFSRVTQEILRKAWARSPILLGQMNPSIMMKAAAAVGIKLDIAYFDPGEQVRRARLASRPGWDPGRVERRIARSNVGYAECRNYDGRELKTNGSLQEFIKNYDAETMARMELTELNMTRVPAKFVHDWTGPLSRRLEIEMDQ